jgi:hypothetical protein
MTPIVFLLAAVASAIPTYDIDALCRGAADCSCVTAEENAESALTKDWATYPEKIRADCGGLMRVVPVPSYVQLLLCVQIRAPLPKAPGSTASVKTPSVKSCSAPAK